MIMIMIMIMKDITIMITIMITITITIKITIIMIIIILATASHKLLVIARRLHSSTNAYLLPSSVSTHLLFMALLALTSSKTSHPRTKKLSLIFLNPEGLHVPRVKKNNDNNE